MRYNRIDEFDVCNGEGVGASLFVQGCHFHCVDCFNKETWDFNGGHEWTDKTMEYFMSKISPHYIKRVSILGGEPLAEENVKTVLSIVKEIRKRFGLTKSIWIYTGYTWDALHPEYLLKGIDCVSMVHNIRANTIFLSDVLVDGQFQADKKDFAYPWAGSTNQRVIDIQKSINRDQIILYGQ